MSAVFAADAKTIYCLMPGRTGESGGWEYDRIIASPLTGISLILIIMIVIGSCTCLRKVDFIDSSVLSSRCMERIFALFSYSGLLLGLG